MIVNGKQSLETNQEVYLSKLTLISIQSISHLIILFQQVLPIMQIEPECFFAFNLQMFQDISVDNKLHIVEQPQIDKLIFDTIENGPLDQPIEKDENDDSKSEICQETLQNTGFRKIPEQIVEQPIQTRSVRNNHRRAKKLIKKTASKSKAISKRKQGFKKDYKKNICGYITRRVLKQSLSTQYQQIIEDLCKKFKVPTYNFYKIYRAHNSQNITGPTHFYNLVNPRIMSHNLEECIKEISTRMVFVTFFLWFVRNRYIRYLLGDGKMTQKDKYVNYKDREMMFLIVSEHKQMLERARNTLKDGFSTVETVMNDFSIIYSEMTENNRFEMSEQKEQKTNQKRQNRSIEMTQLEIESEKQSRSLEESESGIVYDFGIVGM